MSCSVPLCSSQAGSVQSSVHNGPSFTRQPQFPRTAPIPQRFPSSPEHAGAAAAVWVRKVQAAARNRCGMGAAPGLPHAEPRAGSGRPRAGQGTGHGEKETCSALRLQQPGQLQRPEPPCGTRLERRGRELCQPRPKGAKWAKGGPKQLRAPRPGAAIVRAALSTATWRSGAGTAEMEKLRIGNRALRNALSKRGTDSSVLCARAYGGYENRRAWLQVGGQGLECAHRVQGQRHRRIRGSSDPWDREN